MPGGHKGHYRASAAGQAEAAPIHKVSLIAAIEAAADGVAYASSRRVLVSSVETSSKEKVDVVRKSRLDAWYL